MKVSLDWIKDYVDLSEDLDLKQLAYDLTMTTVEVEDVIDLADQYQNIVVGEIKEVNAHPNADRLRVCTVDVGDDEDVKIVCGGSNLESGEKVAVALPGAMVRWHGEGEPVEIKKSKLRGVESYGMICAASELQLDSLFPAEDDHEILDLTEFEAENGTPIAEVLNLDDIILEIDNKSMTNRPDLWGHYGMAREIAALYKLPLKEIEEVELGDNLEDFDISIEAPDRSPRYIGVEIDNVDVKPSPYYIQNRLWKVGTRPINALVDVTNYVMLSSGQPTHAFDADNITNRIIVRRAEEGERLDLLNDKQLELTTDDLVIADDEEAVALAGVMGGSKDSILPDTKRIILEIANFEPTGVRRTALRYDNRTEASSRYEKAIDPQRCDLALNMSIPLLTEIYPDLEVKSYHDEYLTPLENNELDVSLNWLNRRLGKELSQEDVKELLERLGFEVSFSDEDTLHIIVPSWRSTGDVGIKADIMEEVARLIGYENFEPEPITTQFDSAINQLDKNLVRSIKEYLAFRCNMQEIYTYPWMKDTYVDVIIPDTEKLLKLSTPPAPNEKFIRSTLLPNICEAVAENERYYTDFAIFEEAQVFKDEAYTTPYDETELLPSQTRHLAGAFAGHDSVMNLFRRAKGVLEAMPRFTHMKAFTFEKIEKPYWADKTVWLNICLDNKIIGELGLLSKKSSLDSGIKNLNTVLFEINLDALEPFTSRTNTFAHLPEYPIVDYDMNFLFDRNVKWMDIESLINEDKSGLLQDLTFIDEYTGKQIPDDKKSITFRMKIGSDKKTLTSEEVEQFTNRISKKLKKKFNAELRS